MKKAEFNPYIFGDFSYADIYASLVISTTDEVCKKIFNWNILQEFKKISEVINVINAREVAKIIYDDIAKGMEELKKVKCGFSLRLPFFNIRSYFNIKRPS